MKRNVGATLLTCLCALTLVGTGPALAQEPETPPTGGALVAEALGWPLGVQCWTFRKSTLFESVDFTERLGLGYLEMYPGQPLSPEQRDVRSDHSMPAEAREQLREKLDAAGVRLTCYGVVGLPNDEAGARRVFEFARQMGIETIVSEPDPAAMPMLDGLAQEYGIGVALHNHPRRPNGGPRYWNPQAVVDACEGLSPRVGACADTGHWMRSGVDPLAALRLLEGRLISFHFKDTQTPDGGRDVPFGSGAVDLAACLTEIRRQGVEAPFSIEYAHHSDRLMDELAQCVRAFDELAVEQLGGWQVLFDGSGLAAWQNPAGREPGAGWAVEDGALVRRGKAGYIWTRERFGDFVLDLEFQTEGNSGLFFRTHNLRNVVQTGLEMQIERPHTGGRHGVGAIYDLLAPRVKAAREGWNHVTLMAAGPRIAVVLNGRRIIDMNLEDWDTPRRNPDGSRNKFRTALRDFEREGHIGFQDHGHLVRYRNVRIVRLPTTAGAHD